MEKAAVVDLPQNSVLKSINVGLGWDKGEFDLDVSAFLLDAQGNGLGIVHHQNRDETGVSHSGDNRDGDGDGDDESINVDLENLAAAVKSVFFVINIYDPENKHKGKGFADVANCYCRVTNPDAGEMCRYQVSRAGDERALVIARIFREHGDVRWGFQAIGAPCISSSYYPNYLDDLKKMAIKTANAMAHELRE